MGGRKSGWLRINWDDVDLDEMVIRFNKTKGKQPREVPIITGLMQASLADALKLRNAAWPDQEAVFVYDGKRTAGIGRRVEQGLPASWLRDASIP